MQRVVLDQSRTHVVFDSGFDSVDQVQIISKGGVDAAPGDGEGTQVGMDDFHVHFETPPPAAHAHFVV